MNFLEEIDNNIFSLFYFFFFRFCARYSMVPPGVLYVIATKQSDAGSYR